MTITLAILVPLLPFLGGAAGLFLGRTAPGYVRPLAVLPTLFATALAVVVLIRQGSQPGVDAGTRLTPTGSIPIDLAIHLDGFAVLIAVLVGVVASAVQIYSTEYLRTDPRYPSYAALVSLFTSAMLLVVYSGDLMVLLVGWEVMGICSYFLIGHSWETAAARSASSKAFLVTKLGDVPFLIGLLALASAAGTFRINGILTTAMSGGIEHPTVIGLLLLAGVAGKSAQFPLHSWLPDAMAGPTPVSALIHAATMVAAGVYFVARLLPVFLLSTVVLAVLAVMAAVTMIGSALCALAQDDIKRVLAYSTIGQLGYMTAALAVGDRGAAVFHLLTHGAFKALLFLGAGVVIHAAGTNSLTAMSRMGDLRQRVPDAGWTMTVALAALAALFPFSGFFSKESVLRAAEHAATGHLARVPSVIGWIVLVSGLLTALLTAAYATRLWLRTFGPVLPHATAHAGGHPGAGSTAGSGSGAAHPAVATGAAASVAMTSAGEAKPAPTPEPPPAPKAPLGTPTPAAAMAGEQAAVPAVLASATRPRPAPQEPAALRWPLWALFIPTLGLGVTVRYLPKYFDGGSLNPTLITSVLGMGLALVGVLITYAAWRAAGEAQPRVRAGADDPRTAGSGPDPLTEPAGRPDPTDPGRLLLGPLHRSATQGFHLDRLYHVAFVRPVLAGSRLVRFLDQAVVDSYVRGAGRLPHLLGAMVRRTQTGNVQTYLSALLAGAVVIAVLVAVGA